MKTNVIYNQECLQGMSERIPDNSIDMILADLPYGKTQNKWDSEISLESLWKQYHRIAKDNTPFVLTATQPFTSKLVMSNIKNFKYTWVWEKNVPSGFLNAKKMPLRWFEEIAVFYRKQPTYNPQFRKGKGYSVDVSSTKSNNYREQSDVLSENNGTEYYPKDIVKFDNENGKGKLHPTQKPVALFKYLIKTYTNKGDIVLDNVIGSGTTAVAAKALDRQYIGFEQEEKYVTIARERVSEVQKELI